MTDHDAPKIDCYAYSDTGKVREDNQDCVRVCEADDPLNERYGRLYAIADGMGGYSHGGLASSLALETFFNSVYSANAGQLGQAMRKAIQDANLQVYQQSQRMRVGRMGTTLTAVSVAADQLHIGHVGDSRAYLIRDGKATCVTSDHTMVGDLVRMRVLTPEKVRTHAQRSVLNKCLGVDLFVQPDVTKLAIRPGDIIILCTDGVWSVIEDDEFGELASAASDVASLAQNTLNLALERDSDDNVSVVAIHAERLARVPVEAQSQRNWGLPQIFRGRSMDKS